MLSSTKDAFEVAAMEYFDYLTKSGYEENLLKKKLNEVRLLKRDIMLQDNKKMVDKEFITALVVDSHPGLPNIRDAWKQAKEIVSLDPIAKKWCEAGSRKIVTAFRRGIHMSEELRAVKDKVVSNNDKTYKPILN